MDPLLIDGESLTVENVYEVAFDRRPVRLHPGAIQKMGRSRAVVDAIVKEARPVYGISTRFGQGYRARSAGRARHRAAEASSKRRARASERNSGDAGSGHYLVAPREAITRPVGSRRRHVT